CRIAFVQELRRHIIPTAESRPEVLPGRPAIRDFVVEPGDRAEAALEVAVLEGKGWIRVEKRADGHDTKHYCENAKSTHLESPFAAKIRKQALYVLRLRNRTERILFYG